MGSGNRRNGANPRDRSHVRTAQTKTFLVTYNISAGEPDNLDVPHVTDDASGVLRPEVMAYVSQLAIHFQDRFTPNEKIRCSAICWEIGGREGRAHFHIAIHLKKKMRYMAFVSYLETLIPRYHHKCDVQACTGTWEENRKYVTKLGNDRESLKPADQYWIQGEQPQPGKRNDILDLRSAIRAGSSADDCVTDGLITNGNSWKLYHMLQVTNQAERDRNIEPKVHFLIGEPGSGKTRAMYDETEQWKDTRYVAMETSQWFEGYTGQLVVLVDDIRANWCHSGPNGLVKLIDRYPCRVAIKGSSCQLRASTWYFTSVKHPEIIWNDLTSKINAQGLEEVEPWEQFNRRITTIREFKKNAPCTFLKGTALDLKAADNLY